MDTIIQLWDEYHSKVWISDKRLLMMLDSIMRVGGIIHWKTVGKDNFTSDVERSLDLFKRGMTQIQDVENFGSRQFSVQELKTLERIGGLNRNQFREALIHFISDCKLHGIKIKVELSLSNFLQARRQANERAQDIVNFEAQHHLPKRNSRVLTKKFLREEESGPMKWLVRSFIDHCIRNGRVFRRLLGRPGVYRDMDNNIWVLPKNSAVPKDAYLVVGSTRECEIPGITKAKGMILHAVELPFENYPYELVGPNGSIGKATYPVRYYGIDYCLQRCAYLEKVVIRHGTKFQTAYRPAANLAVCNCAVECPQYSCTCHCHHTVGYLFSAIADAVIAKKQSPRLAPRFVELVRKLRAFQKAIAESQECEWIVQRLDHDLDNLAFRDFHFYGKRTREIHRMKVKWVIEALYAIAKINGLEIPRSVPDLDAIEIGKLIPQAFDTTELVENIKLINGSTLVPGTKFPYDYDAVLKALSEHGVREWTPSVEVVDGITWYYLVINNRGDLVPPIAEHEGVAGWRFLDSSNLVLRVDAEVATNPANFADSKPDAWALFKDESAKELQFNAEQFLSATSRRLFLYSDGSVCDEELHQDLQIAIKAIGNKKFALVSEFQLIYAATMMEVVQAPTTQTWQQDRRLVDIWVKYPKLC